MNQEPLEKIAEDGDDTGAAEDTGLFQRLTDRETAGVLTEQHNFQRVDFPGNLAIYLIGHCDGEMLVYKCADPTEFEQHGVATYFDRHGIVHRQGEDFSDPYGFTDL